MKNAIEARNLGKAYNVRGQAAPTILSSLSSVFKHKPRQKFWALKNVDFDIPKGQTVGVVGPNGSGKSSTLGLIAGTITPSTGSVRTEGMMSTLLELGAGFHPELSGRENVFLNASILGIPREDIGKRMDHIIEFSGLQEFIDQPVKNYSSGMYVRLGFAVAVEVNPEILLIDEVLAVGDISFQLKCMDRIRDFQRKGKTILFVSHALQTVEEFCDRVFLVHHGELVREGPPDEVILEYTRSYMGEGGHIHTKQYGTGEVQITGARFLDENGEEQASFYSGKPMQIEISYDAEKRVEKPVFGFALKTGNGFYLYGSNTQNMKIDIPFVEGKGKLLLKFDPLTLMQGNYFLSLSSHSWDHMDNYHRLDDYYIFGVKSPTEDQGIFHLDHQWVHQAGGGEG